MVKPIIDEFTHILDASTRWRLRHPEKCKESGKKSRAKYQLEQPERFLYYGAKNSAKERGIEFSIELSDIVIPEYCPVLGIKLHRNSGKSTRWASSPTIDRIDNTKGYIKGNICVISWRANDLKSDSSLEELIALVKYVETYLPKKENLHCVDKPELLAP